MAAVGRSLQRREEVSSINPNHEVTQFMNDQWHKLCAVLMQKQGIISVDITARDIEALALSGRSNIVCDAKSDRIQLRLVTDEEAASLARQAGGLPS
jgi:hypothetical protein